MWNRKLQETIFLESTDNNDRVVRHAPQRKTKLLTLENYEGESDNLFSTNFLEEPQVIRVCSRLLPRSNVSMPQTKVFLFYFPFFSTKTFNISYLHIKGIVTFLNLFQFCNELFQTTTKLKTDKKKYDSFGNYLNCCSFTFFYLLQLDENHQIRLINVCELSRK